MGRPTVIKIGSMSPIAPLAGDTRLALHTAIDCAKQKPPAQQPLSDSQIDKANESVWGKIKGRPLQRCREFAREIEAAHGIKEKL